MLENVENTITSKGEHRKKNEKEPIKHSSHVLNCIKFQLYTINCQFTAYSIG